jgi:glycosyltransferase involved in cell wall biosynthesis
MACCIPVVSTSVGGLPELINHNETGFIAEIGDIDRMARYTIDLLTNDRKYQEFSKNSRNRAVNSFDKNVIVPQYEKLYMDILNH